MPQHRFPRRFNHTGDCTDPQDSNPQLTSDAPCVSVNPNACAALTKQIFLSSSEAQHVVNSLWRGDWVQKNNENDDIDYVPYNHSDSGNFWDHLDPERLAVPRYQTAFRIVVWIIYLFGM